jgi:hypothetical protein
MEVGYELGCAIWGLDVVSWVVTSYILVRGLETFLRNLSTPSSGYTTDDLRWLKFVISSENVHVQVAVINCKY